MDKHTPRQVVKNSVSDNMSESPILKKEVLAQVDIPPLTQETVQSLRELGDIFGKIHLRLKSEGYVTQDGKILKPGSSDTDNGAT